MSRGAFVVTSEGDIAWVSGITQPLLFFPAFCSFFHPDINRELLFSATSPRVYAGLGNWSVFILLAFLWTAARLHLLLMWGRAEAVNLCNARGLRRLARKLYCTVACRKIWNEWPWQRRRQVDRLLYRTKSKLLRSSKMVLKWVCGLKLKLNLRIESSLMGLSNSAAYVTFDREISRCYINGA